MSSAFVDTLCLMFAFGVVGSAWAVFAVRERRLRRQLTRDSETVAFNADEILRRARCWVNGHAGSGAAFLVSMDHYAEISAMLRVCQGAELLGQVAARLVALVGVAGGAVGRTAIDEFTVYLPGIDATAARLWAGSALAAVSRPYDLGGQPLLPAFSLSAALYPMHGSTVEEVRRSLHVAMLPLKEQGAGGWTFFEYSMIARQRDHQLLEHELRLAMASGAMEQFDLHYQPLCDGRTGRVLGCEALLRWNHPALGPIDTELLIELAEQSGLIVPLGRWVLEQACLQAIEWPGDWHVHVNLSVRQMRSDDITAQIADVLARTGLSPRRLVLEVTESLFIRQYDRHVALLNGLRARGIGVALDDFGSGYSSLNHLRRLPFDWLKLDRGFVAELESDYSSREIVASLLAMCRAMNLSVVAEGVETEAQRDILNALGCHVMQGFLLGRPVPAAGIRELAAAMS